jgi:peptide/nickel transport system substrate-binding protein
MTCESFFSAICRLDFDRSHGKTRQKIILIILLLPIMMIVQTCKKNTISNSDQNTVYRLAIKENIESFDPVNSVDETSGIILNLLHRNLYTTDVKGNLVNDLVESSHIVGDSVYVSIKPEIHFNDVGKTELTSEDVVYSLLRLKTSARQPWTLDKAIDIQVLNRYTVIFMMKNRDESIWGRQKYLLSLPQCAIYSKAEHQKNNQFLGASTFTVTNFQPGSLQLTSTLGFQLDYKVISSDSSRWFYYRQNLLDVYEADGIFRFLKNNKTTYDTINVTEPIVMYAAIVSDEKSVLDNREFRRALNYKFDRKNVAAKILMNSYEPADYPVPDILNGTLPEFYRYDEKYNCAGFHTDEIVNIYSPSDRDRQLSAMVIKKVLRDCGVQSKIRVVDLSTLLKINNEKRTGIYLLKWIADYPHAENFIIPLFHSRNSGSGGNRSYYKNERLDDVVDREGVTSQNIKTIEEMIRADAPWIFIGFARKQYYVNKEKNINLPMMYTGWNEEVFSKGDQNAEKKR